MTLPRTSRSTPARHEALDGLRGGAIALVLWHHLLAPIVAWSQRHNY
jgi:hypothetical protein